MGSLVYLFLLAVLSYRGTGQVISQPDDVTICEGEGAVFTCVLNSNISSDDVQWYRFIKDTSTTVMVDPNGENINIITHTNHTNGSTTSSLNITNAIKSDTGYFWVGISSLNVCNASLTVVTKPPALRVNIMKNITNSSIVVQWDEVDAITYTVTWTDDGDLYGVDTVDEQTSYIITGLTLDTVYIITVAAANMCGQGPIFSISVSLSTATTSTTISLTLTASTNTVSTVNPSSTTTAIVDTSSNTITTINTPIITTTDSVTTTVRTDSSTKITTVETIMTSISPSTTTATTADETSDSNVAVIAGAAVGGIIIAITIVIIFIIICYFGRRKNGEKNNYNDFSGDGTLNKNTSSVPNSLYANQELGKTESSQQPALYMTSDIGNKKPPHPSGPQKKIETQHQQTMEYAVIDNVKKKEQEHQNGEADTQLQQQPMEYAVVDKSKKKNRKKDKQQNVDQAPSDVPTVTTSNSANQNRNNPLLHYAELETLPAPTDTFMTEDNSRTPYAQVS